MFLTLLEAETLALKEEVDRLEDQDLDRFLDRLKAWFATDDEFFDCRQSARRDLMENSYQVLDRASPRQPSYKFAEAWRQENTDRAIAVLQEWLRIWTLKAIPRPKTVADDRTRWEVWKEENENHLHAVQRQN